MNDRIKFLKGRIYQVLFEHGPKTYADLLPYLPGLTVYNLQRSINHDKRQYAPERNTFRVVGYHRNIGKQGDMSPIIGLGPGPDVPKPIVEANKEAGRRKTQRVSVRRAYRDDPAQCETALAALHRRHTEEANDGPDRAARVFASMFLPPPAPVPKIPRRVYKTRGG